MEEKEKIIFTVFGIVAIIAVVGLIGIFNKPTYILIPLQGLQTEKPEAELQNTISGMAAYDLTREQCLRYKSIYSRYAWFEDWQWFKDNCEAKYDLSEPQSCEGKYLDEYQCVGDILQRKIQIKNCETGWRNFQYCKYGCYNGKCKTELSTCTEKYLDDYKCSGRNSQRLYQITDCSTYYKDFEICKNGCDSKIGRCNIEATEKCVAGYLDEYKCEGNYLQRAYQYSNCLKVYHSIKFCNNGCSDNKCS